jgi:LacI family transcriptional regulator
MAKPNMSAIARAAGVGKATVSLALRNDPRLRPETRERIQKVAAEMGYRANAIVSNLMAQLRASRNPKYQSTLAVFNASPERESLRTNHTFRGWMDGLRQRAEELGYGLDEFWLEEPGIEPGRLRQILHARNIRGGIIAGILNHRELPAKYDPIWEDLASVVVGVRPERPPLHFACNDQYSTALHAAEEVRRQGYTRPGLVIAPAIEENIDHRFSAGFYAGQSQKEIAGRVPPWDFDPSREADFQKWLRQHRPDVLVCTHPELRDWVTRAGLRCPEDIGLLHLDVTPALEGWSGMDQNNGTVGAFAVDLVVGQLHRNENGIPDRPKCMMTESVWVAGETLRQNPEATSRPAVKSVRTESAGRRSSRPVRSK